MKVLMKVKFYYKYFVYVWTEKVNNEQNLFPVVVSGGHVGGGWGRSHQDGQNLAYKGQH